MGELFTIEMALGMDASALGPAAVVCRLILHAENTFEVATESWVVCMYKPSYRHTCINASVSVL